MGFFFVFFFFLIVIPNIARCIVTGSPLPSQKPPCFSLRRRGQSSPESTQGRWSLLCKLCTPKKILFLIFALILVLFVCFILNGQPSWPPFFVPQLEMYEGFWSPWEWVEVRRQSGLSCTLTWDQFNKVHTLNTQLVSCCWGQGWGSGRHLSLGVLGGSWGRS